MNMKQHNRSDISTRVAVDRGAERVARDDNRFNAATVSPMYKTSQSTHGNMEGGGGSRATRLTYF